MTMPSAGELFAADMRNEAAEFRRAHGAIIDENRRLEAANNELVKLYSKYAKRIYDLEEELKKEKARAKKTDISDSYGEIE